MNPYESPKTDEKKRKPPETDWLAAIIIFVGLYGSMFVVILLLEFLK